MNVKMLQEAWKNYFSVSVYQEHLRFGQYVYNEHGYEFKNSYEIADCNEAYELLFDSLTIGLDEI